MFSRKSNQSSEAQLVVKSLRRLYIAGLVVLFAMFGGLGGWAALAEISGAVIAPGSVTVEGNSKRVQHLDGGIVSAIGVRNSDIVQAGQVLVQLDDTDVRAQLQITQAQRTEMQARKARLVAERDGHAAFDFDVTAPDVAASPLVWKDQARLFEARRATQLGREAQQLERIAQLEEVGKGLESQRQSKDRQIEIISEELAGVLDLETKQLVPKTRITTLQRELSRLEGEQGQLNSEIAKTKVQVSETRLAITEGQQTFLSDVLGELREVETKFSELTEREIQHKSKLKRLSVVAPQAGVVHKLTVHTVGGVIAAGETIMEIVPRGEKLVLEGQLDPLFIEQVRAGQSVSVRLTAFDHQTTPELEGVVEYVSADVRQDSPQSPIYYAMRVTIYDGELSKLDGGALVPGMPVELVIRRSYRTVLSYLAKPILDQFTRVFRER